MTTTVAALESELLNAAELSHRCNGWETRWFFRSMRERDADKLSLATSWSVRRNTKI